MNALIYLIRQGGQVVAGLFATSVASAQTQAADTTATAPLFAAPGHAAVTVNNVSGFGQVILSLLFVLVVVLITAWLLQRLRKFNQPVTGGLRIVSELSLGAKERVVLLRVGMQHVLLGVAPGRVTTLHVFEPHELDAQTVDAVAESMEGTAQVPSFKAFLRQSLGLK